jgi:hypothetical protein
MLTMRIAGAYKMLISLRHAKSYRLAENGHLNRVLVPKILGHALIRTPKIVKKKFAVKREISFLNLSATKPCG